MDTERQVVMLLQTVNSMTVCNQHVCSTFVKFLGSEQNSSSQQATALLTIETKNGIHKILPNKCSLRAITRCGQNTSTSAAA
eukprot:3590913-Amphidinium_carterae.1